MQAGRFRICSGGLRLIRPGRINTGRPGSHRAVQIPDPIGPTRIRSCRPGLAGSLKARLPASRMRARNSAVLPASPNGPYQRRVWELSRELWRVWDDDAAALESEVEAAGAAGCEADSMPDSIDWSGVDGAARDGFRGWPYRSSARGVRPTAVPVLCVCNNSQVCLRSSNRTNCKPCKGWFYRRHHDA